ncbi:MAG: hypothetical protein SPF59_07855, partial [Oscillospiraceae bacterium]|nr:hypothetical protein [Oscillospiraceae bacterium]
EALGGGSGRRLYCWLTSFSQSLQTNLRITLDGTLVTFHDLTASLLSRKRASAASALRRAASALGENLFFARFSAPPM